MKFPKRILMRRCAIRPGIAFFILVPLCVRAQDFRIDDHEVQIHGFISQGFVHTNDNNWLTMETSHLGSGEYTDFGVNASSQLTDNFRIGAQLYDRNLGGLGRWYPSLDWGYAQYRFKPWFGVRGGRVKTVLGLYNDTHDLDFLHPWALLPQGVYPIDLRDSTIAHDGGDLFGDIRIGNRFGTLSYTAYGGHRQNSSHGGVAYLIDSDGLIFDTLGGPQYGADLRWRTPLPGLMVGASRQIQDNSALYTLRLPTGSSEIHTSDRSDFANQFYGEYAWRKVLLDAEFRHQWDDNGTPHVDEIQINVYAWYVGGAYRIIKRLQLGSYYSHYEVNFPIADIEPVGTGHDNDKVITGRIDINRFFNVKAEGHFMDGVGLPTDYPNGFYLTNNQMGLQPDTKALVIKGGFNF